MPNFIPFQSTYTDLPNLLYTPVKGAGAPNPEYAYLNKDLIDWLGLPQESFIATDTIQWLTGNPLPDGASGIAMAYAGHQFGHLNILGDGRAMLLGEFVKADGTRWDLHLKGSGPTPYSRGGDGKAALGPMLREYLISEAMFSLGIPTSRSLAVIQTGEWVKREQLLKGALLVRLASSHLRVGTFEYAAILRQKGPSLLYVLKALTDYAINRHDPDLQSKTDPYLQFYQAIIGRQAKLVAQWQGIGFIHGVLNTDNTSISGETIDYGPCAFMNQYHPNTVFSSIDHYGRYAYGQQPSIIGWNLARLAEALMPLFDEDAAQAKQKAQEALQVYPAAYTQHYNRIFANKIGFEAATETTNQLVSDLLARLKDENLDFTSSFVYLALALEKCSLPLVLQERYKALNDFIAKLEAAYHQAGIDKNDALGRMKSVNPFVIPRNHWVERAIATAEAGDYQSFDQLLGHLREPYLYDLARLDLAFIPEEEANQPFKTFCGT